MERQASYDKFPFVPVSVRSSDCAVGWPAILERLREYGARSRCVLAVDCYPGVSRRDLEPLLNLGAAGVFWTEDCFRDVREMDRVLSPYLGDDPVFGRMNGIELRDFFDAGRLAAAADEIGRIGSGLVLALGTGATLLARPDILVYADLARWEIQGRQRRGEIGNLAADNRAERPSLKYKRAFFVDWRAADRLKKRLLPTLDFLLDTNDRQQPKLIAGDDLRRGLAEAVRRPFRVVPLFDPGPWGGQWMREVCGLDGEAPNYAWCFDCVPEENSLLLGYGDVRVEVPAIDLVLNRPRELLGDAVYGRFGTEFPIRFDFLDTMDGGNLSLQVHPLTEYIQEQFGMTYTQDESYYLLDAAEDAVVYLGLVEGTDREAMARDLRRAQETGEPFPDQRYVTRWPARRHDHFLIPAGTVHCSGRNSMVLEISATPYIFTFKLWDWGRLGLDGLPRPISLEHGLANIQWDRTRSWVERHLINRVEPLSSGAGWREERTGLHEREFIETRRHWFSGPAPHDTRGGVNVLNLVDGQEAVVESPTGSFEPFVVHYAETFIVPAAVGAYTIRPSGRAVGRECATIKAFVRTPA